MGKDDVPSTFEQALTEGKPGKLQMRLFVAGFTPRSQAAIDVLRQLVEERLDGNYQLEVIDIYQQPGLASQQQIIATPTLGKNLLIPKKILIGDQSGKDCVLTCLGLAA